MSVLTDKLPPFPFTYGLETGQIQFPYDFSYENVDKIQKLLLSSLYLLYKV